MRNLAEIRDVTGPSGAKGGTGVRRGTPIDFAHPRFGLPGALDRKSILTTIESDPRFAVSVYVTTIDNQTKRISENCRFIVATFTGPRQ